MGGAAGRPSLTARGPRPVDDELFPFCNAERLDYTHTDEYGVIYICDLVEDLGYGWVQLGRTRWPPPRRPARSAGRAGPAAPAWPTLWTTKTARRRPSLPC